MLFRSKPGGVFLLSPCPDVSCGKPAHQYRHIVRFVMFVIDGATETASPGEISAIDEFNDDLARKGQFVIAVGIGSPETAKRFDHRANGTFTEDVSTESLQQPGVFYSGFWIVDAANKSEAEQLAARASRACNRRVELRPLLR